MIFSSFCRKSNLSNRIMQISLIWLSPSLQRTFHRNVFSSDVHSFSGTIDFSELVFVERWHFAEMYSVALPSMFSTVTSLPTRFWFSAATNKQKVTIDFVSSMNDFTRRIFHILRQGQVTEHFLRRFFFPAAFWQTREKLVSRLWTLWWNIFIGIWQRNS